jgi:hypothetical protein
MRLKRSEYNIMKDVINAHWDKLLLQAIRINQMESKIETNELKEKLEVYWLHLDLNLHPCAYYTIKRYEVSDYEWEMLFYDEELSEVKKRFEWYKDGIENGECGCDVVIEIPNCKCKENTTSKKVLNSKKK